MKNNKLTIGICMSLVGLLLISNSVHLNHENYDLHKKNDTLKYQIKVLEKDLVNYESELERTKINLSDVQETLKEVNSEFAEYVYNTEMKEQD